MTGVSVGKMIWKPPALCFAVNGVITFESKLTHHHLNEVSPWKWRV